MLLCNNLLTPDNSYCDNENIHTFEKEADKIRDTEKTSAKNQTYSTVVGVHEN